MAEELGWDIEDFDKAFGEVLQQGMAKADFRSRLVWLPNAIKYNKPESPNVVRGWATAFQLLPECALKLEAFNSIKASVHALGDSFGKAFEETFGKAMPKPLVKAMPNQEQEQEQEQKQESQGAKAPLSPARLPTCPTSEIIGLYNSTLPELPRAMLDTKDRPKAIQRVWKWCLTSKKIDGSRRAETRDEALAWFKTYFERARNNDFLMGRSKRGEDHENWRCDLDFLLTDKGMKHVIEKTKEAP